MPNRYERRAGSRGALPIIKPGTNLMVRHGGDMFPATVVEVRRGRVRVNIWVEGSDEPLVGVYRLEDVAESA